MVDAVHTRPESAPPAFRAPPPFGYLLLTAAVAPPVGPPLVRRDARRAALTARLRQLAARLAEAEAVERTAVYRAVLIPPAPRGLRSPARYDVAVLVTTSSPDAIDEVRGAPSWQQMLTEAGTVAGDVRVLAARCLRNLGEVDTGRPGLFLFNFFTAPDAEDALRLWERLAGWYAARTGLDNSTLLAPLEGAERPADWVFVNHARWDMGLLRFALAQFARPSFHTVVRAGLRAHGVVAMPNLYRLA